MSMNPETPIVALGRDLHLAQEEYDQLETLTLTVGREQPHGLMNAHRLLQRHVETATTVMGDRIEAIENLILASRPTSLADVLVQLMVGAGRLGRIADEDWGDAHEQEQLGRVMQTALPIIAAAAKITLAEVGGRHYAPVWLEAWPKVGAGSAGATSLGAIDQLCIDGSGGNQSS